MNISNHQIMHIVTIIIFVLLFIYNITRKNPLKSVTWNELYIFFIVITLIQIYKTYKKENTKVKVI
jgi:hypothetical protein